MRFTISAFSRAGLVFDGLLVINLECRTNDPFIFAAGTMAKYSRRFYSESRQHQYYNSVEIGERVSMKLSSVLFFFFFFPENPTLIRLILHSFTSKARRNFTKSDRYSSAGRAERGKGARDTSGIS